MSSDLNWVHESYETAQICENGHIVNRSTRSRPANNKPFCTKCGFRTYTRCPQCNTNILGTRHYETARRSVPYSITVPPSYCHNCGAPYPWTERAMETIREAAEHYLPPEDAEIVIQNLPDIARDTPRAGLAAQKVLRAVDKGGQPLRDAIKDPLSLFVVPGAKAIMAWMSS